MGEEGMTYVSGALADEEDGCCGLLLGFSCGVLGGPGVNQRR